MILIDSVVAGLLVFKYIEGEVEVGQLTKATLTEAWIKKRRYVYTMEYYSSIKKNTFESVLVR